MGVASFSKLSNYNPSQLEKQITDIATDVVVEKTTNKMDKQPTAIANNLAMFDTQGQVIDSLLSAEDITYLNERYDLYPAYQDFINVIGTTLTITQNQNSFNDDLSPNFQDITDPNIIIVNTATLTLADDPTNYPRTSNIPIFNSIITATNLNQAQPNTITLSHIPRTQDKDNIRVYYIIRVKSKDAPKKYNDFPKNVKVDLQALDTQGLATDDEVYDLTQKTRRKVVKYVNSLTGNNTNDGNTEFEAYLTPEKGFTDITPSGEVKILGAETYNITHTFASSKQSIKITLDNSTKITGTLNFVSGNTSMQFFNGKVGANINDASNGTMYFSNCDLSGANLSFNAGGYKQIRNATSCPAFINLINLPVGTTGTLELHSLNGGVVSISVGTGWTVLYSNCQLAIQGAVGGLIVDLQSPTINAVLTTQAQLNLTTTDGLYILNFANPIISGLNITKGDIVLRFGGVWLLPYKLLHNIPASVKVIDPLNINKRDTWILDGDEWKKGGSGSLNTLNLQETNTVFFDPNYGSNTNDGLSIYTKVADFATALSIAGNGWCIKATGDTTNSFTGNITQNNLTIDLGETTLTGTITIPSTTSNLTFKNGVLSSTINNQSNNVVNFLNTSLTNGVHNHTGNGNVFYQNIFKAPSNITTQNGLGSTMFFDNCSEPIQMVINDGRSVRYNNTLLNITSTASSSIISSELNIRSVLTTQAELNAVSIDGLYIVNFASPSISGMFGLDAGDIIERRTIGGTPVWFIVAKVFFAPATVNVGVTIKTTWCKNDNLWQQVATSIVTTLTNQNANNIIETGLYSWNNGTNTPFPDGTLTVIKRNNLRIYQQFAYIGSVSNTESQVYQRVTFGNTLTWSEWNLIVSHAGGLMTPNRLLASNETGCRAISTNINPNSIALFTTSSNVNLVNYPIGSYVLAQDFNAIGPARNSTLTVKNHSTQNYNYVFGGQPGTALDGTWRAKGRNQATNAPVLWQRVL